MELGLEQRAARLQAEEARQLSAFSRTLKGLLRGDRLQLDLAMGRARDLTQLTTSDGEGEGGSDEEAGAHGADEGGGNSLGAVRTKRGPGDALKTACLR